MCVRPFKLLDSSLAFSILAILFIFFDYLSANDDYVPIYNPSLEVSRAAGAIKIDGELGDPGWVGAAKADNFAEHYPGDRTKPPVETEALITYDYDNLYVAMICYDDPAIVRASFGERERVGADDNICLLIDTYADAAWAYELNVNPYGIQADALWSRNGGEDGGYDLVWESAGKITDSGYQIEMAIPFSSLRFPNKPEQVWKVDFWRNHPRDLRRQYSWAAYDRDNPCWPCEWGTITGIRDVQPGKGIEIMPTLMGYQAGAISGEGSPASPYKFVNDNADGEISLGGKYAVSSDITLEATYNPDFSQVEADPDQIDVNTNFALSLAERRPFFQEGSDLFLTSFTAVYTRSINDPEFAGKLTARLGRTSIAYLAALDENTPMILPFEESSEYLLAGRSFSNIVRARRALGEDSHIGLLATDRHLDGGGSNTLLSADWGICFLKNYRFDFQFIATRTAEANNTELNEQFKWIDTIETATDTIYDTTKFDDDAHTKALDGEKYWGHALYGQLSKETANTYMAVNYIEKSPTYRADNGFQPSNNFRSLQSCLYHHIRLNEGLIERIVPSINLGQQWNFAGDSKIEFIELATEGYLRVAQFNFHALYRRETERYAGIDFRKVWNLHNCMQARPNELLAFGGSINYGHQISRSDYVLGKQVSASAWLDIKPRDRMLLENWYNYIKSNDLNTDERLFEGYILRSRLSYQLTRHLSLRVVGQYNDFYESWDLDPLLTYRLNPFSIFYIGTTMDYGRYEDLNDEDRVIGTSTRLGSRQFFMKLQYLFQL